MPIKKKVSSGTKAVKRRRSASTKASNATVVNVREKAKRRRTKQQAKESPNKIKMARDSFTMPKDEYAQLKTLKVRLAELDRPVKKSELLRAGIKQLAMMTDAQLMAVIVALPVIKTGRPKKQDLI